jgi:hypothetical protein
LKGEKIEKVRSDKTLLEFSETTLVEIAQVFIRVHEKFSRFYVDTQFEIEEREAFISGLNKSVIINRDNIYSSIQPIFSTRLDVSNQFDIDQLSSPLVLGCKFLDFNRNQKNLFNYKTDLKITFEQTKFTLQIGDTQASYLYTKEFEDQELEEFLKIGAKEHLAFINEKTNS